MFLKIIILISPILYVSAQNIYEPCALTDISCIRDHLSSHSSCDPRVFGTFPDSFSSEDVRFEVPYFRISHVDQQTTAKGLNNCTISAFYVDVDTRTTVLGLDCLNVRIDTIRQFITHDLNEIEQIYTTKCMAHYDVVRMTVNMHGQNLDLCKETAYAYTTMPSIKFQENDVLSAKFISEDPREMFGKYLDVWVGEIWGNRATPLVQAWVRNVFCNFKCEKK